MRRSCSYSSCRYAFFVFCIIVKALSRRQRHSFNERLTRLPKFCFAFNESLKFFNSFDNEALRSFANRSANHSIVKRLEQRPSFTKCVPITQLSCLNDFFHRLISFKFDEKFRIKSKNMFNQHE